MTYSAVCTCITVSVNDHFILVADEQFPLYGSICDAFKTIETTAITVANVARKMVACSNDG